MNRLFRHPMGEEFSIPADWIDEAGVSEFTPPKDYYLPVNVAGLTILPIMMIAPPPLYRRSHLTHGGFDRNRMVGVLREIRAGDPVWPIQVMEWPHQGFGYILAHGVHRFHASVALGFTHVPTVAGWVFESERPASVISN